MTVDAIWSAFTNPDLNGPGELVTHIRISLIALAAATVVGCALGIGAAKSRSRLAAAAVVVISNLGRTVPTFALMALVVAFMSIGEGPALVGLAILGIPPILLNAHTAIRSVDPHAVESARGMGFTPWGILTRVELPLAVPLLVAGVRISAVQIVATAVLAAAVGAGGLGVLILAGLSNSDDATLLAGAIPTAALAVGVAGLLGLVQYLFTPRGLRTPRRHRRVDPPSRAPDGPALPQG